ncbi:hypothetical protein GHK92_15765 [Nocardioides sp. dk4132]|uniref:hypothetical protein n=1 Tax=unclassified Nocardioides TaxID=2615069 RepID=UPI00129585EE|nr:MULTISPECIES: hypothetical protein [unclassified Nocardioides]MQW77331.1 hypothetical protein [Nocardioides sp. dk4132]QGA08083.1 hypothetical protein GFH29_12235 [Nocardioides sp. dk884]
MSVGDQLGLDDNSELLDRARQKWPAWVAAHPGLGVVDNFDDLRAWLPAVDYAASDEVLLALAMLAAPDGGDDIVAAAALAKCLLPGASRLAGWLSTLPLREVLRDSQPVMAGTWSAVERIDELVASQLWIEVRTFKWRRLRKVAANVLINTRVGVLREVGDFFYVSRADRTWANTTLVESFASGDVTSAHGGAGYSRRSSVGGIAGALCHHPEILTDAGPEQEEQSATEELLELLAWACDRKVISPTDRYLLLCLVEEAYRVETRRLARGYGGLLSNEVSGRVAPRIGVSEATVRRHGSSAMRALAAAAPRRFGDDV